MDKSLTITKIPHLDTMVVRQKGVHFFVAVPDSFIIDKEGFLQLIAGALDINFVSHKDVRCVLFCKCELGPVLPVGGYVCEVCKRFVYGEDLV